MIWAWIIALVVCVVAVGILVNRMEEKDDDKPNGPFLHGPFDPGGFYTD